MQGCSINQNSALILEHNVIFFLMGPVIYFCASPFCQVCPFLHCGFQEMYIW